MKKCLLCVLSAVLIAAALPVSAYGYPETALPDTASWETAPEGFDAGELERELRERMGAGEDTGDMDILPEVSAELMDQMAQMQSIIHPVPKIRWDEGESMVYYTLPNEEYFSSSIPNGMLTTRPVTFLPMKNARTTVYRSGMKITPAEDGVYGQPGNYRINLLVLPGGGQNGDSSLYEIDFYFSIIPEVSSQVSLLTAPEGFYIDRLEQDQTALKPENPRWHFLSRDGAYRVRFVHEKLDGMTFETAFVRDTKAPLLSFDPAPDRYAMNRTVHVAVDDPAAAVEMYYNGKPVSMVLSTLEIGGNYQYRLTDSAGNERYYAIKMADRFRMPGPGTIMITCLALAGAAAWLIYQRRHPRFL